VKKIYCLNWRTKNKKCNYIKSSQINLPKILTCHVPSCLCIYNNNSQYTNSSLNKTEYNNVVKLESIHYVQTKRTSFILLHNSYKITQASENFHIRPIADGILKNNRFPNSMTNLFVQENTCTYQSSLLCRKQRILN